MRNYWRFREIRVSSTIINTLHRLEYRGYDSAGIATLDHGVLTSRRAVGKLSELVSVLDANPVKHIRHRPYPLGDPWCCNRAKRPPSHRWPRRRRA